MSYKRLLSVKFNKIRGDTEETEWERNVIKQT